MNQEEYSMSTRTELLKLLMENTGVYLSGQKIGDALQVSRNAVWKAMQQLLQRRIPYRK